MASSLENFKKAWTKLEVEEARRGFLIHLASYLIVNSFLIFVNLYTSHRYLWFPWILCGWGIGLAFHYMVSRESIVISDLEKKIALIEQRSRERKK
ncbi:MAG: 2TM domain-containing protein [Candidatus Aenigmatarchaeota archaeon]